MSPMSPNNKKINISINPSPNNKKHSMDPDILKSGWFSIDNTGDSLSDKEDDNIDNIDNIDNKEEKCEDISIHSLLKRIEECERTNQSILQTLQDINTKMDKLSNEDEELRKKIKDMNKKVLDNESTCNVVRNENLKLINRILEAEISVERTTNILLRKNISFPFTKLNL